MARPTKVSVDVGRVKVPVLTMLEMIGDVSVLLVSVSAVSVPTRVVVAAGSVTVTSAPGLEAASRSSFVSALDPSKIKPVVANAALLAERAGSVASVAVLSKLSVGLPETPSPLVAVIPRLVPATVLVVQVPTPVLVAMPVVLKLSRPDKSLARASVILPEVVIGPPLTVIPSEGWVKSILVTVPVADAP